LASSFDGIADALQGDTETAAEKSEHALAIQRRLGDHEGAGVSLSTLAQLAAGRDDLVDALDLYGQALAAFEAIGDRAEEARILSEMAWTHLGLEDAAAARRYFFESVRAYTELASIRGVGSSSTTSSTSCPTQPGRWPRCLPLLRRFGSWLRAVSRCGSRVSPSSTCRRWMR